MDAVWRGSAPSTGQQAMIVVKVELWSAVDGQRTELHVWNLVAKALTGMGYGKEN
jgi:hypothetical protein